MGQGRPRVIWKSNGDGPCCPEPCPAPKIQGLILGEASIVHGAPGGQRVFGGFPKLGDWPCSKLERSTKRGNKGLLPAP